MSQSSVKQVLSRSHIMQYYIQYSIMHQVVSNIGEEVGTIWKRWPGFSEAQNMDHEYFGLEGEFRDEVM